MLKMDSSSLQNKDLLIMNRKLHMHGKKAQNALTRSPVLLTVPPRIHITLKLGKEKGEIP